MICRYLKINNIYIYTRHYNSVNIYLYVPLFYLYPESFISFVSYSNLSTVVTRFSTETGTTDDWSRENHQHLGRRGQKIGEFKSSKILPEKMSTISNWFTYRYLRSWLPAERYRSRWRVLAVGFCKKKMGRVCGPVWHEGIEVLETAFRLSEGVSRLSHQENANVQLSNIQQVQRFISLDSTRPIQAFKFSISPMCTSPLRELAPNPS